MNCLVKTLIILILSSSVKAGDPFMDLEPTNQAISGPRAELIGLLTDPDSMEPTQPFCRVVSEIKDDIGFLVSIEFRCITRITGYQVDERTGLVERMTVEYGPSYTTGRSGINYLQDSMVINKRLMTFIQERIKPALAQTKPGERRKSFAHWYKTEYGSLIEHRQILFNNALRVSSRGSEQNPPTQSPARAPAQPTGPSSDSWGNPGDSSLRR